MAKFGQIWSHWLWQKRFYDTSHRSCKSSLSKKDFFPRILVRITQRPLILAFVLTFFLSFFRVTSNLRPEKNKESDFSLNLTKQMTDNKFIRPAFRTVFGLFDPSEMCLLHVEVWELGKSNWFIMLCVDFCVISIKCYRTNIYLMSKLFWMIYQSNFETATFGIIYTK